MVVTLMIPPIVLTDVSMVENILSRSLEVYPNPSTSEVTISFEASAAGSSVIRVRDLSGKEILVAQPEQANGKVEHTLNIGRLADGVYMLEISNGALKTNQRLIKQ